MAKKSKRLREGFTDKRIDLEGTRTKYENLYAAGHIDNEDIHKAYAGLYLELFTEFEALIENLFLGLLTGDYYSTDPLVIKKIKVVPRVGTIDVVFGGKAYVDWLPYDNTHQRSNRFFHNGYPFSALTKIDKDRLFDLHKIRNAIAHKSKKAKNDFMTIISGLPLLPHEQTPAGYLRSIPNPITGARQFEIASSDLDDLAIKICV